MLKILKIGDIIIEIDDSEDVSDNDLVIDLDDYE